MPKTTPRKEVLPLQYPSRIKLTEMDEKQFNALLNNRYSGEVKIISRYYNHQTTSTFQCDRCKTRFFGRPDYILGARNGQTHECFTNYGSTTGYRDKPYNTKTKLSKKRQKDIANLFNNGLDLYEIGERLKIHSYSVYKELYEQGLLQ